MCIYNVYVQGCSKPVIDSFTDENGTCMPNETNIAKETEKNKDAPATVLMLVLALAQH